MTEVSDAIMENGGTGELEKLLEETHGGREEIIRMSIFEQGNFLGKSRTKERKETGEFRVQ
jgi:hypothetical protein